ncbi:hypothetical protein NDU88_006619 [Pleurodeles waltl]|uniref:Uncharacterized protein n=1 Tax=Pleurodeles waltl TaxID=8319 RepID=A0AAV7VRX2_PLEWA|nr:hypothetical protein NDU88_006619 [Pleurodeles waltl]
MLAHSASRTVCLHWARASLGNGSWTEVEERQLRRRRASHFLAPEPFLPKDGEATLRWEEWREYFVNYISTFEDEEELTPEKKKKILLHCLGAKGLKIYNSINKKIRAPEQGDVFSHALEDLTEYFRPAGEDVLRCSRTVLRAQCVYTGHEHR